MCKFCYTALTWGCIRLAVATSTTAATAIAITAAKTTTEKVTVWHLTVDQLKDVKLRRLRRWILKVKKKNWTKNKCCF